MTFSFLKIICVSALMFGLAACNTTSQTQSSNGSKITASQSNERVKLKRSQIIALYTGKRVQGAGHYQIYKADGTWTGNRNTKGRWSVTSNGTLVLRGDVNLRLAVYRKGNRFIHKNVRTGQSGNYRIR